IIQKNFHSSLPVYEDVLDNLKGVLSLNEFLMNIDLDSFSNDLVKRHMKKPYFIPETTSLSQQLIEFKSKKQKTAFAVDEYGNIQGLITIEDIFEEIVGDYLDETEKLNKEIKPEKIEDHYIVNASSNIRVLNKMMNWNIPIDEAKTINGAVLENLGSIPDVGTDFRLGGYLIEILSTKENAVEKVKITKTDDDYELKVVS
ncbi:MAG: transporter associated domain-containing protein, partial [Gammaproteobacteria bacterium]